MAGMLEQWDFTDEAANGTEGLINRQKSAGNLIVLALDEEGRTGLFLDREKKIQSSASLVACDCRDFNFVGKSPRKTFQPCKHIYRLAMELGFLEPRYLDHEGREALRARGVAERKRIEDDRLLSLGRDPTEWGGWPADVHRSGLQMNRQYRAYFIVEDEADVVHREGTGWRVREYLVSLDACECNDFRDRRLPCKHIYAAALRGGCSLAFSRVQYLAARRQGLEIVFEFDSERPDPLSRI
jgi:hypothetical protein